MLDEVFEHRGCVVWPNQKLSQIITARPPGITAQQWNYATRAHLDFVVCNKETTAPDFAIELDDPTHRLPSAIQKDQMKDAVCDAAELELLRIESSALRPGPDGRRLIEYLIESREFCQAFVEAQENGEIPWDEWPDYRMVLANRLGDQITFPNDLTFPARKAAFRAHEAGRISSHFIPGLRLRWKNGWAEAWAWLRVRDDFFLFEQAQVRSYRFACGLAPGELAQDIATAEVGRKLEMLDHGAPVLVRLATIRQKFELVKAKREMLEDTGIIDRVRF